VERGGTPPELMAKRWEGEKKEFKAGFEEGTGLTREKRPLMGKKEGSKPGEK